MLCSILRQTGVAGYPAEFFGPTLIEEFRSNHALAHAREPRAYLDRVKEASTTPNGVFGMKLLANQTPIFLRRAAEHHGRPFASLKAALDAEFPALRYITLARENTVAQAISYYRGLATGIWQWRAGVPVPKTHVEYDSYAIARCYQDIRASERYWQEFMEAHGITPLTLTYEALVADFAGETRRILEYLSLPSEAPIKPPQTTKLADTRSCEWEERFRHESLELAEAHLDLQSFWAPY
jgi:LPS sulfotransferase NodH